MTIETIAPTETPGGQSGDQTPNDPSTVTVTGTQGSVTPGQAQPDATPTTTTPTPSATGANGQAQFQPTALQPAPAGSTQTPSPVPPKGVSPDDPNANHPAVQAAGRVNSILNAILPPRVQTKIDVNTGETTKTPVPRSRGDIAMAIALEAISGGLAGLQGKGPTRFGQAAAYGLQQGQEIEAKRKAEDQQQAQEASADYARHANILETNMRMWQNANVVGKQSYENNQAYVSQYRPLADRLMKEYQGSIKAIIPESKFSDYHVTKDNVIPYSVVPRPDAAQQDGQAKDKYGTPLWDIDYAVVDPNFKINNALTDKDKDTLSRFHVQGFSNGDGEPVKWGENTSIALNQALGLKARASGLNFAEDYVKDMADTINDYGNGGRGGFTFSNTKTPDLPTHKFDDYIHEASIKTGVDENLLRGVILRESHGNPDTVGGSGEHGLMQILPSTAADLGKQLGLDNINGDSRQNILAGATYLSQQLARYNGDARLALAAYNAGPQNVTDHVPQNGTTPGYVNDILNTTGIGNQVGVAQQGNANKELMKPIDFASQSKDNAQLPSALSAMIKYVGDKKDVAAEWDNFKKQDPDDYATVVGAMPAGTIRNYSEALTQKAKVIADRDAVIKQGQEQQQGLALKQQASQEVENILKGPDDFQLPTNALDLSPQDLKAYLEKSGGGVDKDGKAPDRFEYLYSVGHLNQPLDSAPQRVWATGSPKELDREQVITYIQKFINPNFSAQAYDTWNKFHQYENNKDGAPIKDAGVAAQHTALLQEAAGALHNSDWQYLNEIKNTLGVKYEGKPGPAMFDAIAAFTADEVSKVGAGSAPYELQVEHNRTLMNSSRAPEVISGVANSWTNLMYGRISNLDQTVYQTTGRHLDNITPQVTQLFQKQGNSTPWVYSQLPKAPKAGAAMDPTTQAQYWAAAGGLSDNPTKRAQAAGITNRLAIQNGWNIGQGQQQQAPPQQRPPQQKPNPQTTPSPITPPNQNTGIVNDNDEADSGNLALQEQD